MAIQGEKLLGHITRLLISGNSNSSLWADSVSQVPQEVYIAETNIIGGERPFKFISGNFELLLNDYG